MRRYEAVKKPHIYFRNGWWRVTHMPPHSFRRNDGSMLHKLYWGPAHAFIGKLNEVYLAESNV